MRWARRGLCAALVLATMCALPGCGALTPNDQGWEMKPSHPPLPAYFIDTTPQEIALRCPPPAANWTMSGCAVRYYALNRCNIYVEPGAPHWLAGHELEHCAGFDHEAGKKIR